ncbi:hypothetical protein ACP70R_009902 [Stipagrostis hirtigluma subsp. patula]
MMGNCGALVSTAVREFVLLLEVLLYPKLLEILSPGISSTAMALPQPVTCSSTNSGEDASLEYAASAMQGYRVQMEDAHITITQLRATTDTSFFAVYDGHGGPAVANFCKTHLRVEIIKHDEFQTNLPNAPPGMFLRCCRDPVVDGCTACVPHTRGNQNIVGNAGDSCCVLSGIGQASPLYTDDTQNVTTESQRIEHVGLKVTVTGVRGNIPLIEGIAAARAIGDLGYKDNAGLNAQEQAVAAFPDVRTVKITHDVEMLIVACVGILISSPSMAGLTPVADGCAECIIIRGKQLIVGNVSGSNSVPSMSMQVISSSIDHNPGVTAKKQRTENGEINRTDNRVVISISADPPFEQLYSFIDNNNLHVKLNVTLVEPTVQDEEYCESHCLLGAKRKRVDVAETYYKCVNESVKENGTLNIVVSSIEPCVLSLMKGKHSDADNVCCSNSNGVEFCGSCCLTGVRKKRADTSETKVLSDKDEKFRASLCPCLKRKRMDVSENKVLYEKDEEVSKRKRLDVSEIYYKVLGEKVQFTVKIFGQSLSVQKILHKTTVKELVLYCCQTLGVWSHDMYALLDGRVLCNEYLLSQYPIHRDSTVDIRTRQRGGQHFITFNEKFGVDDDFLIYEVPLPPALVNTVHPLAAVLKFAKFTRYNLKDALVCVTTAHRNSHSYDGKFTGDDLLYGEDHHVHMRHTVQLVPFCGTSCRNDYRTLARIFANRLLYLGDPQYFRRLLHYLRTCPAGENSNHEAAIAFLINHPALECYLDREKQCMLLDNVLHRLDANDWPVIEAALGRCQRWWRYVLSCPAMNSCLYKPPNGHGPQLWNQNFTEDPLGAIHYSNIFFKHAPNNLRCLEQLEAAHSYNMHNNLADMLERITIFLSDPKNVDFVNRNQDLVNILGNALANKNSGTELL